MAKSELDDMSVAEEEQFLQFYKAAITGMCANSLPESSNWHPKDMVSQAHDMAVEMMRTIRDRNPGLIWRVWQKSHKGDL